MDISMDLSAVQLRENSSHELPGNTFKISGLVLKSVLEEVRDGRD